MSLPVTSGRLEMDRPQLLGPGSGGDVQEDEATLVINPMALPGTSLADSDVLRTMIERIALEEPEVVATSRRTGRAEMSEHAGSERVGDRRRLPSG